MIFDSILKSIGLLWRVLMRSTAQMRPKKSINLIITVSRGYFTQWGELCPHFIVAVFRLVQIFVRKFWCFFLFESKEQLN